MFDVIKEQSFRLKVMTVIFFNETPIHHNDKCSEINHCF